MNKKRLNKKPCLWYPIFSSSPREAPPQSHNPKLLYLPLHPQSQHNLCHTIITTTITIFIDFLDMISTTAVKVMLDGGVKGGGRIGECVRAAYGQDTSETWAPVRVWNWWAFLSSPMRLFKNVIFLCSYLSILFLSLFPEPFSFSLSSILRWV